MTLAPDVLDRDTAVPLHYQVSRYLRQAIARGVYPPGALIPPELTVASDLNLSRATVRQGIATLVAEGLLSRRRGIGTIVASPQIEQPLHGLYTMAGLAAEAGSELTTQVLRATRAVASPEAAMHLGLRAGRDEVVELERQRLLDGTAFALERVALPFERCAALLQDADLTQPLYELLERCCATTITGAREQLMPVNLALAEAKQLGQKRGTAAFRVERTGLAGEEVVEWRVSLIRGDRYLYSVQLTRAGAGPALISQAKRYRDTT